MVLKLAESVLAHVGLPLRAAGASRKEARRAASAMIDRVGASEYADAAVPDLSEGQRMRVALAQAPAEPAATVAPAAPSATSK